MDYSSINAVANQIKGGSLEEAGTKGSLFLEFAIQAGTSPAAMWIIDSAKRGLIEADVIPRALTGIPHFIRRPTKKLVDKLNELNDASRKEYMPLVMAHLVRRTCDLAGDSQARSGCTSGLAAPWADTLFSSLQATSDLGEKHLYLSAMANLQTPKVAELLKPMAHGKVSGVDDYLQKAAIRACFPATLAEGNTAAFMLPIFLDTSNGHESRIEAVDSIFSTNTPDLTTLSSIMTQMFTETDYEVLNFVFTIFEKYSTEENTCFSAKKAKQVGYFLKYLHQMGIHKTNYAVAVSKTFRRSFTQSKYGYGGGFDYWVIGSHGSFSPLEFSMRADTTHQNRYKANLVQITLRLEGLDRKILEKFHTMDKEWKVDQLK